MLCRAVKTYHWFSWKTREHRLRGISVQYSCYASDAVNSANWHRVHVVAITKLFENISMIREKMSNHNWIESELMCASWTNEHTLIINSCRLFVTLRFINSVEYPELPICSSFGWNAWNRVRGESFDIFIVSYPRHNTAKDKSITKTGKYLEKSHIFVFANGFGAIYNVLLFHHMNVVFVLTAECICRMRKSWNTKIFFYNSLIIFNAHCCSVFLL